MKIVSQSPNQMVLQEGSAQGLFVGAVFLVGGLAAGIALHAKTPMALWIGLAAAVVGAGIICFASAITVDANKSTGQLVYRKKRLVGAQNTTYQIAEVLRIETRKQWHVENTPPPSGNQQATPQQPVLVAQSVIVFKSGKELALDHQKTASNTQIGGAVLMSGMGKESALANRVAEFLGVPFQEIAPPAMMGIGGGLNIRF